LFVADIILSFMVLNKHDKSKRLEQEIKRLQLLINEKKLYFKLDRTLFEFEKNKLLKLVEKYFNIILYEKNCRDGLQKVI